MNKIIIVGAAILAVGAASVAGCLSQREPYYTYNQPQQVIQQQPQVVAAPAPVYVQQPQGAFGGHGDAILAGAAGYLAGKHLSGNSYRPSYRPTTIINRTYVAPSRSTWSSRPSYRSSSFGSFRSRRR